MNNKTLRFLIPALGAALLLSCNVKEPLPEGPVDNGEVTPVTVALRLSLAGEVNGMQQTRAIDDPGTVSSTEIRNVCILQYRGTDTDAPLVGQVHYLSKDLDPDDEDYLDFGKVKLADSWGAQHTLVILTNTFTRLGADAVATLGQALSLTRMAGGEADVFGHAGQGDGFPDDTGYYQRMSALAVSVIENGATLRGTLRRSMARIIVEIENDGTDGLQIQQVQLRNVSQKDYYVTDYTYIDPDDNTTKHLVDTEFQDVYNPTVPMRTDYTARNWAYGGGTNDGSVQSGEGTGTATYTWYVPSNMRGTDDIITIPSEKNRSFHTSGATYLYVIGKYGADHDQWIAYTFYLGENLVNNFDLKPNTSYTYRLTFNGKGMGATDTRIEDYGSIDFDLDANCYIVNPSPFTDRKYTFNVVHRPNIFWGTPNGSDRYGMHANVNYANNFIGMTEDWHARIVWSDFAMTQDQANAMLSRKDGTGGGGYMDATQRVELTIPTTLPGGGTEGNIVVGVYTDTEDNILWSWHIWITSYQPDEIAGHAPDAGTYVYNVHGGEVHHYNLEAWITGRYKNGYAMDRDLGAKDEKSHVPNRGAGMFYQFGRKDPFPASYTIYAYDHAGNRTTASVTVIDKESTGQGGKNVPYSVRNPLSYIKGANGGWTLGDIFNPNPFNSSIVWQDPSWNVTREENEERENAKKSFFDPCPPGWQTPVDGWVKGLIFGYTDTTDPTANAITQAEALIGRNRGSGITYFPNGFLRDKNNPDAQTIFFSSTGRRYFNSGGVAVTDNIGQHWSSTPSSIAQAISYQSAWNGMSTSYNFYNYRLYGYPVRCVRE